jgi:hypothetical protein
MAMVLISGISTVRAGDVSRTGTSGAPELLIPVGASGIALGEAGLIFAQGADAMYWNPAGIAHTSQSVDAMFSHMQYFGDIGVDYGAVAVQAGDFGSLGFSLKSISFGQIPVTTADYPDGTGEQFSPTYIDLAGAYSKNLSDRISVGVSATLVSERIVSTSASGVAFNFGVVYDGLAIPGLDLGIAIKNVGPDMTYGGPDLLYSAVASGSSRGATYYSVNAASFSLPSSMEIGLGYKKKLDDQNSILLAGNFVNNNASADEYGVGGQYGYNDNIFLRASYIYAPQAPIDPSTGDNSFLYDWSVGAGVHYDTGGANLAFDYAYRHQKFLESNNVITLRVGF